jgi:hypothetical protein
MHEVSDEGEGFNHYEAGPKQVADAAKAGTSNVNAARGRSAATVRCKGS